MRLRTAALAMTGLVLLAGCAAPRAESPVAEQGRAIATVFETSHPYSPDTIDSVRFADFFARHPEYRGDSTNIANFYARRGMQSAWIVGDSLSASAEAFIGLAGGSDSLISTGGTHAHPLQQLHEDALATVEQRPRCDSCLADLELRLTAEFFRFADRQYNGYFSRDLRDLNWFIPRAKKDLARLIDSLATGTLDLSAYEPMHPQYQRLKRAMASYSRLANQPWPALKLPGKQRKLVVGDSGAVIGAIRQRLQLLGDLQEGGADERFDSALVDGVKQFQERHGLQADGVVGVNVLRQLNVGPSARLRTMLVNIERLRWIPERQPSDLMVMNIPEFRLHVFDGDRQVLSMKTVVGARATHTVVFSDTLTQIVFSPSWTVPESIVRKEILPALRKNPGYLVKNHMEIVGGSKALSEIRQKPGADNALGRIKFLFPNSFDIYMHDTPAKSLFNADSRTFSHGCIRLSQPRELAEFLLRDDSTWTAERIDSAMYGEKEMFVKLRHPRPVLIVYFTAWVDAAGRVNFRDDVYGHDAKLAAELFGERQE